MLSREQLQTAALFALAALPAIFAVWGFSVDDAWISVRVAENLAGGHGYRFNRYGPITDAVTPLGWAPLLSLVAGEGSALTLDRARWLGALAWLGSAAVLGGVLSGVSRSSRALALAALGLCLPLAAWGVSGMETPWVTLLATLALLRSRAAALAAGVAAAWRPELLPWALALSLGSALVTGEASGRARRIAVALAFALVPAALVAGTRWALFGTPVPLAAVAKPSDFSAGLGYTLGALCLSGPPWLLVGFGAYRPLPARARVWAMAFGVHAGAIVLAGGDWMSFFRLFVPVLPSVIAAGALLQEHSTRVAGSLRAALVLVVSASLWLYKSEDARGVMAARTELIERTRPALAKSQVVAAVDIGWIGAATPATLVDLAGVTDPTIAPLPGGHTTKRVPSSLLVQRQVDTLVLLLDSGEPLRTPWYTSRFYYGVDAMLAAAVQDLGFEPTALVPLPRTEKHYVVLRLAATGTNTDR